MQLSRTPFVILRAIGILSFLSLATSLTAPSPYILSPNQNIQIPLLSLASGSNITFTVANPPPNLQLINSAQAPTTIPISPAAQNVTASYISDTYIAFVDQSLNFSYIAAYEQNATSITLSQESIEADNNTQCTSITSLGEYIAIACAALENSTNIQNQTLVLFDTSNTSFSSISLDLPYTDLQTPLPAIIKATQTAIGPVVLLYFNNVALQNRSAVVVIYNIENSQSNTTTISSPTNISIQSIEATYNGVYVFDASGIVYYGAYNSDLTVSSLSQVTSLGSSVIGSCVNNEDYSTPALAVFSSNSVYYILNSQIQFIYSLPSGMPASSCSIDSEFLSVIATSTDGTSLVPLIYNLNNANNGYPLVQGADILIVGAISSGQSTGQLLVASQSSLTIMNVQEPKIQVTNVAQTLQFNLSASTTEEGIPINITVLQDTTQIYQKDPSVPIFSSFQTPTVDIQSILVGPSLGVAIGNNTGFFNGVYGACSISNFGSLNISSSILSLQVNPSQQYTSTNNVVQGVVIYNQGANIIYNNIEITNMYSAGTWNSPQSCTGTVQSVSSTPYNITLTTTPQKCLFGQDFDICLLTDSTLAHISQTQGLITLASQQQCQDVYLWQGSAYNQDVSVCINTANITILNETGSILLAITAAQAGVPSFSSQITTNSQYPNLLIVSSTQGLTGLQVDLSIPQAPITIFTLNLTLAVSSYVQLTSTRLVLVDFTANTVSEWDVYDISSPYSVGNYNLFSFQLNSTILPTYQPIPNHLILYAINNNTSYLLTLQPGNMATSTLLYATNLQDISTGTISSWYDSINQYTVFFASNSSELNYFYASNSTYITLANSTNAQSTCLYCSSSTSIQASSNVVTSAGLNLSMNYVIISTQQTPISTLGPNGLTIKSGDPASNMPTNWFQGTVLDYSIQNLSVSSTNAIYMTTPLNVSLTAQKTYTLDPTTPQQISVFSDGTSLYILRADGLSSITLSANPYVITDVQLVTPPANVTFVTGNSDSQGNTTLAYTDGTNWGIYMTQSGLQVAIPVPIVKVKVLGNFVFALTTVASNLIYVINTTGSALQVTMTVQSSAFNLSPIDFEVVNLADGSYAVVVVDGSDNLYNFIVDVASMTSHETVIPGFTNLVKDDLPPSTLQILAVQVANQALPTNSTNDFLLTIGNYHSYIIQLAYDVTTVQFVTVLDCLVQMPGHVTIGQSFMLDDYFLDVKQAGSMYYLYNYPLAVTYPANSGQAGAYAYVKPVHRQILASNQNIGLYAGNGIAFVGANQQASPSSTVEEELFSYTAPMSARILDQQATQLNLTVNVQSYMVSNTLEVGFNPSLSTSTLSDIDSKQVALTGANDIGSTVIQISLDTPINILNSAYFIAFTCVFTVVFCVACIWFFRRAYKKRKMKMLENKESYHSSDPAAQPANEEILIQT